MTNDPNAPGGGDAADAELKQALQAALRPPVDQVDWERLHATIMTAAETQLGGGADGAYEWMSAWSARGVPAAAAALAVALFVLLGLPIERRTPDAVPPGFVPVAEELMSNLPGDARRLLSAGFDMESLLRAMLEESGREREIT